MALLYFLGRVAKMGDRLVGGITATVSSMIFGFIRSDFARLFDGETNLSLDYCFDGGSIILDIPVHTFLSGQMAQSLFKYVWQKMVLKRDLKKFPTPVSLVMDESQHFVARNDLLFTSTCRSARCCCFYLTQNLDVLQHQIGQADMEGLVGNLCTKIATSNDHVRTNTWYSSMCGEEWSTTTSASVSLGNEGQMSSGVQDQRRYNLEPHELVKLRKPSSDFLAAEAVVFRAGRLFCNGSA
jgi:type IV secretory pathway TraG/TraD family ATPase VirD4